MENKVSNKYFYIISVIVALLVIGITISASFAFFTNTGSSTTGTATVITSGSLSLELVDGNVVGTTEGMVPGDSVTKTFIVRNTGTITTTYDVYFSEVFNNFSDKSDLVYSLTSSAGGYNTTTDQVVPSESGEESKIVSTQLINGGESHTYTLTIKFLNKNENQDDNKDKTFSAKLQINEYKGYVAPPPTVVEYMTNLASGADSTSIEPIGETGLAYDGTVDNNLRYVGSDPNNYVNLPLSDGTTELHRIIGIFNNNTHGKNELLVKTVKADNSNLNNCMWSGTSNNWNNSFMMNKLNENNDKRFKSDYVETVTWKTGATFESAAFGTNGAFYLYTGERGTQKSTAEPYDLSVSSRVGLYYMSDVLFSTSGSDTITRETCLSNPGFTGYGIRNEYWHMWEDPIGPCSINSWIIKYADTHSHMWTLSTSANYNDEVYFIYITSSAGVVGAISIESDGYPRYYDYLPSVYLKSSVRIVDDGNDGSLEHPYNLTM